MSESIRSGCPPRVMAGGAEALGDGVHFRVWAPRAKAVQVALRAPFEKRIELAPESNGYFSGWVSELQPAALYGYLLDGEGPYPDPYSRYQPSGPHGPSMVTDPGAYRWQTSWAGVQKNLVIYELHVGAFTEEGTFRSAARELPELADLGISCIELMPIGEFPGRFNWGYDAVALFAPYHGYGEHEALKYFVDSAHAVGIGVILDVVYNHLGPDGNYLPYYSPDYFTDRYPNEWGESLNFELPAGCGARELVLENVRYWLREFQLDGLRLDATQSICDATRPHVLAQLAACAREVAAPRSIILIAENEPQRVELLQPASAGGFGLDAIWNDDFHHSVRVAITGARDGYLHDYRGRAQEIVSLAKYGFLFQGQHYFWQGKQRGTPALRRAARSFVNYVQNHDQVANTLCGLRLHNLTSPGRYRAATALLLLSPQNPMLFMGQEFCASAPFPFFADCKAELADSVRDGRRSFLRQFTQFASTQAQGRVPDPCDAATFESAKLSFWERRTNQHSYALHRELLRLRAEDSVISRSRGDIDGAVLGERAALLRWFDEHSGDRLLLINFGEQLELQPVPEPLLAPPSRTRWQLLFSSDDTRYGGLGALLPLSEGKWTIPAECALLLYADGTDVPAAGVPPLPPA